MNKFLLEFQSRLKLIAVMFLYCSLVVYSYKEFFFYTFLQATCPTQCIYFIVTDVSEIFYTYVFLTVSLSFYCVFYYAVYHVFCFLSYAALKSEFKNFKIMFFSSLFFCVLSCAVAFSAGIKNTWFFFLNFHNFNAFLDKKIYFEISVKEYTNFCVSTLYYFFVCFQIPVIMLAIHVFNKISAIFIRKYRKLMHFFCLIFSVLIGPPDIPIQIILCLFNLTVCEFCNLFFLSLAQFILVWKPVKAN